MNIKRLRLRYLRLIYSIAVNLLVLAEHLSCNLDLLRPWLLPDRRTMRDHYQINNRRLSWLEKLEDRLGIEPPNRTRDLRVNILTLVATLQVLFIIFATARVRPENILLIPAFCLYAALTLTFRQYRLRSTTPQTD